MEHITHVCVLCCWDSTSGRISIGKEKQTSTQHLPYVTWQRDQPVLLSSKCLSPHICPRSFHHFLFLSVGARAHSAHIAHRRGVASASCADATRVRVPLVVMRWPLKGNDQRRKLNKHTSRSGVGILTLGTCVPGDRGDGLASQQVLWTLVTFVQPPDDSPETLCCPVLFTWDSNL